MEERKKKKCFAAAAVNIGRTCVCVCRHSQHTKIPCAVGIIGKKASSEREGVPAGVLPSFSYRVTFFFLVCIIMYTQDGGHKSDTKRTTLFSSSSTSPRYVYNINFPFTVFFLIVILAPCRHFSPARIIADLSNQKTRWLFHVCFLAVCVSFPSF